MTDPIERGCEISVHIARPGRSRRAAIVAPQLSVGYYALRLTRPGIEERRNAGGDARPTPIALLLSLHRKGEQMPAGHLSSRIKLHSATDSARGVFSRLLLHTINLRALSTTTLQAARLESAADS